MKYELPIIRINEILESLRNPELTFTQKNYSDLVKEAGQIIKDHRLGTQCNFFGDLLISQSESMLRSATPHGAWEISINSRIALEDYVSFLK